MALNWQNHEWSKFMCNGFMPCSSFSCYGSNLSPNDIKLFAGYSDNGRMPYESNMTAWARSGAESAYYNYSKDYWNEQSDRLGFWGGIWGGMKDGFANYFASPAGAQMTLALGAGITAKLFGFSGDLFKTGAEKTEKKEDKDKDKNKDEACTCGEC